MKRIVISILLVTLLLALFVSTAAAQDPNHRWSIVPDPVTVVPDGCGAGCDTATVFWLVYSDPIGHTNWDTDNTFMFVQDYLNGQTPISQVIMPPDAGTPLSDMGSGNYGVPGEWCCSTANMTGNATYFDGSTFIVLTYATPTQISWSWNAMGGSFSLNDPTLNLVNGTVLEAQNQLLPGDTDDNGIGDPSPAPPVPEIITIALIAIGLIALGGYVWYRRRHMATVAA